MSNVKTSWLITLLFALVVGYSLFCIVSYWNDWNKANSLGRKFLVGYTVRPAGGGLGDMFVEIPLHPPITFYRRPGTDIKFGGWEELREISYIRVVLFVNPSCNTTIVVALSITKSNNSEINVYCDEMNLTYVPPLEIYGQIYERFNHIEWDINITRVYKEPLRVDPHETLTLHVFSKDNIAIAIYSDTYIWIEMRKALAPPPPSLLTYFMNYFPQFLSGVSMILASKIPVEPIIAHIKSILRRRGESKP